jgi:ubiquinol-cytochrome c reductase cytochrome b subunit
VRERAPVTLLSRYAHRRFERGVRYTEQRLGGAPMYKWLLRYVFPDHWSFLLGEIALYSFLVLVGTGVFLALYYVPSDHQVFYHGPYSLLRDQEMSEAYRSVVNLCFSVPAGLLLRQVHHWAANVFLAAIVLHLMRIFFTGAYRKPRDFNYYVGVTMLMLAVLEGFLGYSLVDDLLSGMGLAIANGVALSIPLIGGQLSSLVWGGQYPGNSTFFARLEIVHVFIIPLTLFMLIGVHLAMIMRQHHSQFRGRGRRESNVVGTPMWPAYALRSIGLALAVAAVLFLMGGLIQINPIWQWGPYHTYLSENGAQPDWYIGWLIGALRLMPNWELVIGGRTVIPEPFWGGAGFPLFVFATLYAWPALERRFGGDRRHHDLLDRPRDHPTRTAIGAAFFSWVFAIFAAGATDRVFYRLHISYVGEIHFWRAGIWVLPILVFVIVRSAARALRRSEDHPLRASPVSIVERGPDGAPQLTQPARDGADGAQRSLEVPSGPADSSNTQKSRPIT